MFFKYQAGTNRKGYMALLYLNKYWCVTTPYRKGHCFKAKQLNCQTFATPKMLKTYFHFGFTIIIQYTIYISALITDKYGIII